MNIVEVCVGSSCHVRGSNEVIKIITDMIKDNNWQDKLQLKGVFCIHACSNKGIAIRLNGRIIKDIGLHNANEQLYRILSEAVNHG